MRHKTVCAVLYSAFYIGEIAAAFIAKRVKRTVAKKTTETVGIFGFVAGEKLTFFVLKKIIMRHKYNLVSIT